VLADSRELERRGIDLLRIDRGGEVTLHAPGQLVIYPILRLERFHQDLKDYLLKLEELVIDLLRDFGIVANGLAGNRGVWVGERKIASIGIGVKRWVSFHGLALNVNTDLKLFTLIRPCGLTVEMTSLNQLLGREVDMGQLKTACRTALTRGSWL
jgi:lipoate-protein ligase B